MNTRVNTKRTATRVGEQAVSYFLSVVHELNSRLTLNSIEIIELRTLLDHSCEQFNIPNADEFITVRYSSELTLCIFHFVATSNSISLITYIRNNVFYVYYRFQTPIIAWRGRDRIISYLTVISSRKPYGIVSPRW